MTMSLSIYHLPINHLSNLIYTHMHIHTGPYGLGSGLRKSRCWRLLECGRCFQKRHTTEVCFSVLCLVALGDACDSSLCQNFPGTMWQSLILWQLCPDACLFTVVFPLPSVSVPGPFSFSLFFFSPSLETCRRSSLSELLTAFFHLC